MEKSNKARLIDIPIVPDPSGQLGFIQKGVCPFEIKRVFFMYDLPEASHRGGHSHIAEQQLIISLAGSFTVTVFDGRTKTTFTLDGRRKALYVPPQLWRNLDDFTADAVCLVLSSTEFDEKDYIRDMKRFMLSCPYQPE